MHAGNVRIGAPLWVEGDVEAPVLLSFWMVETSTGNGERRVVVQSIAVKQDGTRDPSAPRRRCSRLLNSRSNTQNTRKSFSTFWIGVPSLLAVARNRPRRSPGEAAMMRMKSAFMVKPWCLPARTGQADRESTVASTTAQCVNRIADHHESRFPGWSPAIAE